MEHFDFHKYCLLASLRNTLEIKELKDEERKEIEVGIEDILQDCKERFIGFQNFKRWYNEYKLLRYGVSYDGYDDG